MIQQNMNACTIKLETTNNTSILWANRHRKIISLEENYQLLRFSIYKRIHQHVAIKRKLKKLKILIAHTSLTQAIIIMIKITSMSINHL